jgi:hypothetical protein
VAKGRGETPRLSGVWTALLAAILAAAVLVLLAPVSANAVSTLPSGFQEEEVFSALTNPTNVEFSQDGRVFVAEKSGLIKVFDGLSDTTPTTFADLRTKVHNFWDRGLLGLALAPNFPSDPRLRPLHLRRRDRWHGPALGHGGCLFRPCPTPPGATADGYVVSGRLSNLSASGDNTTGSEQVLIETGASSIRLIQSEILRSGPTGLSTLAAGTGRASTSPTTARMVTRSTPAATRPVG